MHVATDASTCQLLCALDGVDQNVVNIEGETALDKAIGENDADCVRALLDLNVDTSKVVIDGDTNVKIVQLVDEHRKRSVKKKKFVLCFGINCFLQENERITIRNRVLEEQRLNIQKYFKFQVVIFLCYIQRQSVTFFNY